MLAPGADSASFTRPDQMIIFANNAKPFTYTLKGLPRRVLILKEYQPEIEATCRQYNTQVTSSSQSERVPLIAL